MLGPDERVIRPRLEKVVAAADSIDPYATPSLDDFLADGESLRRAAIERWLSVGIQAAIDVAVHIVSSRGGGAPETYKDAMLKLGALHVLPADLASEMAEAAGLRNVLIYEYLEVDPVRVHDAALRTDDLRRFAAEVLAWLHGQDVR
jgi:uncharacterized protein YutE (UPF0331/DUF86 family)